MWPHGGGLPKCPGVHSLLQEFCNQILANGGDLIFMASHGLRGVSALLFGSEISKVLPPSKIPVLVYR